MEDTAIVGENVEVIQSATTSRAALSWSAAIAGALAATAVTFLLISLGSGIGLAVTSPYGSGPSAATMTIAGAVWLILAQTVGFASGGFIAGRLRVQAESAPLDETHFRDGATGFMAWTIGAAFTGLVLAGTTTLTGIVAARAGASMAASAIQATGAQASDPTGYFVDTLMRSNQPAAPAANANDQRAEVARILANTVSTGQLSGDDRTYLAGIVSARTGMSQDDAQKRVDEVTNSARERAKQVADTARKTAAYFSFWSFMALLFGAVAATLGGILGGDLRDETALGEPPSVAAG